VATGEAVVRDMLYDGNPEPEPGAIVCRVAPSFTRFGNFQLPASRGDVDLLTQLVEHTIRTDFADLDLDPATPLAARVVAWFREVCRRTAMLVVDWMRVGFVHGVLNTDNMSILGLTIDYGPYGWLEGFDPMWTPNTTDAGMLRYKFGSQPEVVQWNLLQLANADTRIVPAYGPVMSRAELQAERDIMTKLYDLCAAATHKGRSAQDMFNDGILNMVNRKFQDPNRFLYDVAKGLQAHYTNFGGNVV
jgi:uncharacterized protein YdiU (UPF0061 family)